MIVAIETHDINTCHGIDGKYVAWLFEHKEQLLRFFQ